MKKFLCIFLLVLLVFNFIPNQPFFAYENTNNPNEIYGELIISFNSNSIGNYKNYLSSDSFATSTNININSVAAQENVLESLGLKVIDSMSNNFFSSVVPMQTAKATSNEYNKIQNTIGSLFLVKYNTNNFKNSTQAINNIKKQLSSKGLNVKFIEPNYTARKTETYPSYTSASSSSMHSYQKWNYEMINATKAWDITKGSKSVKIAVLDTGIDYTHSCLKNFVDVKAGAYFQGNSVYDGDGHGTHVAGTIASYGKVSGVMQEATLIPVKVLNDQGGGSVYGIQQGLYFAANAGVDIVNMSLTIGGYSSTFKTACEYAASKNVVIVAAAGNGGTSYIEYPARYNDVIAVGAVDSQRQRASFSQYGTGLDVMAPGVDIYSTYTGNTFKFLSGTSMATPHVTGVAGLIKSANKNLTAKQISNIITSTAQYAGNKTYYGNGIVDAYAAVKKAVEMGGGTTPVNPPVTPVEPEIPVTPTLKNLYSSSKLTNAYGYLNHSIKIFDNNYYAISGARVDAKIYCPNGSVLTTSVTSNYYGDASFSNTAAGGYGTYTAYYTISKPGYKTITVKKTTTVYRSYYNLYNK